MIIRLLWTASEGLISHNANGSCCGLFFSLGDAKQEGTGALDHSPESLFIKPFKTILFLLNWPYDIPIDLEKFMTFLCILVSDNYPLNQNCTNGSALLNKNGQKS